MRGVVIFLGLLLLLAGGAVTAAQVVKPDLPFLASMPQAKEFLATQTALYAGGGAAGGGLLLMILGIAVGGKKKEKPVKAAKPVKPAPAKAEAKPAKVESKAEPKPQPKPQPALQEVKAKPPEPKPAPKQAKAPEPKAQPAPVPQAPPPEQPKPQAKPQASSQPPPTAAAAPQGATVLPQAGDPRLMNRKRVQDLVTINDALKAYHKQHGAYPRAQDMGGVLDRGANWIPGLSPDYLPELPRDPAMSDDRNGPQYVYASDGTNYKLLANGVSLAGGTNVEVLGVKIDASREPRIDRASFGFWTEAYAAI